MTFPGAAQDLRAELHLDGDWRDVTSQVLARGGLAITRGRSGEDGVAPPSRCQFQLRDDAGDYNPRNPMGTWFGAIGLNTPFRLVIGRGTDTFTRVVASGWGTSEITDLTGAALAWSGFQAGASITSAVGGSTATHTIGSTVAYRGAFLSAFSRNRVDVAVTVSLSFTDVTGGQLEPANIMLGGLDAVDYHMVRVVITTAEAVTVQLMHADGTAYSDVVATGLTHSSGQSLRVRAQMEGAALRAKVWAVGTGEPAGWQVSAGVGSKGPRRTGWVGVRSGVGSGNTNIPVTFTYDDVTVSDPRHAGEIPKWEPRRDVTGNERYVPLEASGILRRLLQGDAPLRSALARATAYVDPVAYWPCEDDSGSTTLASGLRTGVPMTINGTPRLSASSEFDCSDSLPVMGDGVFDGQVQLVAATGALQVRFLMAVDSSSLPTDTSRITRINTGGTLFFRLLWGTGGTLALEARANNTAETLVDTVGPTAFDVNDRLLRVSIELAQVGSDIAVEISTLEVGRADGSTVTDTITGQTLGSATSITMAESRTLGGTVLGHVTVQNEITSLFDLSAELNAFAGESAIDRVERLCAENDIPVITHGIAADSMPMGPQRVDDLLGLLTECAVADQGVLHESVGDIGLSYIARTALYNQEPVAVVSFADHELQPNWEPREDDRATANDVTVSRPGGARVRAVLSSGPMSTASPADGGIGLYDTSKTANVSRDGLVSDVAHWLLALGTVDEPRYPGLTVARESRQLTTNVALSEDVLDLDVGTLLAVTDVENADVYDDVEQIVIGYEEYLNRHTHRFTIDGAPAAPYRVLQLDDAEFGRLDSEATTLNEDLDTTETDVEVAIAGTGSTLWTTVAGDWPFDVMVGGERMTVTAVTGSSSPQTFTVTRSVNGVVKTHSTGAQVRLFRPNRFGL